MNFDRYCGMLSAASLILLWAFVVWTGLWGPVWSAAYEMKAADALSVIVAVIGWVVTIAAAATAYFLARSQIKLAREQIRIQQLQILDTQVELAQTKFEEANLQVDLLGEQIEQMRLAAGYLQNFAENFPNEKQSDGWTKALWNVRRVGDDAISQSAAGAPFGYGARVSTVIGRLQRIGDGLFSEVTNRSVPFEGAVLIWDPPIKGAVHGVGDLASQIRNDIPKKMALLKILADRRDSYAERAEGLVHTRRQLTVSRRSPPGR